MAEGCLLIKYSGEHCTQVPRREWWGRGGGGQSVLRRVVVDDGAVGLVVDQIWQIGALLVLGVAAMQVGVGARCVTADRTLFSAVGAGL